MGRSPGMGALAARHPDPAVPLVLLRSAGHIPAARRAGRQSRRPDRGADPVPGLHARGHDRAVGDRGPAVRAPGRVLRGRAVRRPRPDAAPGLVRYLRRHVGVPDRPGRLARGPGRRPAGRDRLDAGGRRRAGAGQRDRVFIGAVRPGRASARPGHRVPEPRRQGRRRAPPEPAGYRGGADHAGHADRRKPLPARDRRDHAGAGARHRLLRLLSLLIPGPGPA